MADKSEEIGKSRRRREMPSDPVETPLKRPKRKWTPPKKRAAELAKRLSGGARLTRKAKRGVLALPAPAAKRSRDDARARNEDSSAARGRASSRAQAIRAEFDAVIDASLIEHIAVEDVRPNPRNARRHPASQIALLATNIRLFGFIGALIIDEDNLVLSGHGRLEAAKRAALPKIPCIRVTHLTPEAKTAFAIADNRLAELSSWNEPVLAVQLDELSMRDLAFDLEIVGFDTVDLDRMKPELRFRKRRLNHVEPGEEGFSTDPDDVLPQARRPRRPPVSSLGDRWLAGRHHQVLCGDGRSADAIAALLDGERVGYAFTDPPYNIRIAGNVSKKAFGEFAMASGEMRRPEFVAFLRDVLGRCATVARDGAIFHVCMDWKHIGELSEAAGHARLTTKNVCAWVKPSPGMGSFYRSQHEFVFVLKVGTAPHVNNFGLGARGRNRSNVWFYPAVRGLRTGINDPEGGHPTVKPVSLVIDAIRDCSKRQDIVLDPFGGSGTTMIAAERTHRRARLIEIDPHFVDLTVQRWQTVTGRPAILAGDGRTFDQIAEDRLGSWEEV